MTKPVFGSQMLADIVTALRGVLYPAADEFTEEELRTLVDTAKQVDLLANQVVGPLVNTLLLAYILEHQDKVVTALQEAVDILGDLRDAGTSTAGDSPDAP